MCSTPKKTGAGAKPSATVPVFNLCFGYIIEGNSRRSCNNQLTNKASVLCAKHCPPKTDVMIEKAAVIVGVLERVKAAIQDKGDKKEGLDVSLEASSKLFSLAREATVHADFVFPPDTTLGAMHAGFIPVLDKVVKMGFILDEEEQDLLERMKEARVSVLLRQLSLAREQVEQWNAELAAYRGVDDVVDGIAKMSGIGSQMSE